MWQMLLKTMALAGVALSMQFAPEGAPSVVREDHPGLAGAVRLGSETIDVVFVYDGSGSIVANEFAFEKESIKDCIQALPADGTVAVALVQFASVAVVDLPLTVIDSPATAQTILAQIDALTQINGGTLLAPPLELVFTMMDVDAAGSTRQVFILTDGGIGDPVPAERWCAILRTMPVPVKICAALVAVPCPFEDKTLKNCANTCDSNTFNPLQPSGSYLCVDLAPGEVLLLCQLCLGAAQPEGAADCDGDGVPDLCEVDCNENNVPDECEESPGFCVATEHSKLHASDPGGNDRFGFAVAIDVDVIVVGAPFDDDGGADSGSVYVYRHDGAVWVHEATLTASDAAPGDRFGSAVAVAGDVVLVGAPGKSEPGTEAGAAYVFGRDQGGPGNWGQVRRLIPAGLAANDDFGIAVAMTCNHALVGAPGNDDNGIDAGAAYVFKSHKGGADNWGEVAKMLPFDGGALDEFGASVSLDGDVALIGAPGNEVAGPNPGAAYIFRRKVDPELWLEIIRLTADVPGTDEEFGTSVSIGGTLALVGSSLPSSCGPSAFSFRFEAGQWVPGQRLIVAEVIETDEFAASVAVSGDLAVVSAQRNGEGGFASGVAYVYRLEGNVWIRQAKLKASDAFLLDEFSTSIALSCGRAVLGAPGDDDNGLFQSGSAYVFTGLADCNGNDGLDLCDIALGTSADVDGDGAPDECPSCTGPSIRVSQESAPGVGDFDDNVLGCIFPYETSVTPADFYGYSALTDSHDGAFFCPVADRSQILVARTSIGTALVTVHDRAFPADPDGGSAEMRFELFGDPDGAFRAVGDDPPGSGDQYAGQPGQPLFTSVHSWTPGTTDGMVLGGIDGLWTMFVRFTEIDGNSGTPPIAGLSEWTVVSACGADIPLALQVDRRVRLDPAPTCDADLDGDGTVGITDFLALLAAWGTDPGGPPDLDGDGTVGITDFLMLLGTWGPCI